MSSTEQSAGVSDSATIPESTTEITMVTANCLYSAPVMPPMNATGMKTEQRTMTMAISALRSWRIARSAATRADTCSSSMMRSTFSMTMIASSTTIPIESTSPNSVRRLTVKPSTAIPKNVPMIETGTASAGMSVERHFCRKMYTTIVTRMIARKSVISTSWIEAVMNGVRSKPISQCTPGGKFFAS